MRSNYAAIYEKLQKYEKAEEDANKDALFVSDEYKAINDAKEFAELKENHSEFSVEQVKEKLDSILLSYAKSGKLNFSTIEEKEPEKKTIGKHNLGSPIATKKRNKYGSLFSSKN